MRKADGSLSSNSAELGCIILALQHTPADQPLHVTPDSQAALAIADRPVSEHIRQGLKQPDLDLRACIGHFKALRSPPPGSAATLGTISTNWLTSGLPARPPLKSVPSMAGF
jgi:hypothetical protein